VAVSKEYRPQFAFTGGRIVKVEIKVGDDQYLDLEARVEAVMAREIGGRRLVETARDA
jgi:hypothetical protein